jgi:hypothetical protein
MDWLYAIGLGVTILAVAAGLTACVAVVVRLHKLDRSYRPSPPRRAPKGGPSGRELAPVRCAECGFRPSGFEQARCAWCDRAVDPRREWVGRDLLAYERLVVALVRAQEGGELFHRHFLELEDKFVQAGLDLRYAAQGRLPVQGVDGESD